MGDDGAHLDLDLVPHELLRFEEGPHRSLLPDHLMTLGSTSLMRHSNTRLEHTPGEGERPGVRPGAGQPDRRAHRLQRRPLPPVRRRARRDGDRRARSPAARSRRIALDLGRARPLRARRGESAAPRAGGRFVRGRRRGAARAGASSCGPCRLEHLGRPPPRRRPVLVRRRLRGAVPGALRGRRAEPPDRRRARPPLLARRERLDRRADRPARPARRRSSASAGTPCASTCAGPGCEPVPLDLHGHVLATLDSGASHHLARRSGYNERRDECRAACRALGIDSLRDATGARAACPSRSTGACGT